MRQPITLKIKFKSASLDQFIERYSVDVSRGGIFIRTKEPLKVGTQLKFEFQLQDSSALISGEGTVVWIREHDPARTGVAPGMGVRFDKLAPTSNTVLDQILAEKTRRGEAQVESRFDAGVRASATASGTTGGGPIRKMSDFENVDSKAGTPLPKPAPGLDGAEEEFGQESTRVMQDDVVQRLAEKTRGAAAPPEAFGDEVTRARGPEELAVLLRQTGPLEPADSMDRTSIDEQALPKVPSRPPVISSSAAPAPVAPPKFVEPVTRADTPVLPPAHAAPLPPPPPPVVVPVAATAVAPTFVDAHRVVTEASPVTAAATLGIGHHQIPDERPPARRKSSSTPAILGVVGLAAIAGVYFVMSSGSTSHVTPQEPVVAPTADPTPTVAKTDDSTKVAPPNPTVADPVKPSTQVEPEKQAEAVKPAVPEGPTVAVSSVPPGATVTVDGTAQAATTPTALTGLDPKKSYEVTVALKGYHDWKSKLSPKDGAKLAANLVANEKVVEVTSTPAGADLLLDGKRIGRTPYSIRKFDVTNEHKLEVRRGGFIAQTRSVASTDTFQSSADGREVLALALALEAEPPKPKAAVVRHPVAAKKPNTTPATDATAKPVDRSHDPDKTPTESPEPTDKPAVDKPVEKNDKPAEKPEAEEKVKLPPPPKEKPASEGDKPE